MATCFRNGFWMGILAALMGCASESQDSKKTGNNAEEQPAETNGKATMGLIIQKEPFGEWKADGAEQGVPITRYVLSNENGITVGLIDFGAIVQSIRTPDRAGNAELITLGFAESSGYTSTEARDPYFGAICGRFTNRIAKGQFTLDGQDYQLAVNNAPNHLHGGVRGFNDVAWQARELPNDLTEGDAVGLELIHVSPDGDEGYPGELTVKVIYTLNNANELKVEYSATTTKATPINLTNHTYWNLNGVEYGAAAANSESVLDHQLELTCDRYLPVDETMIPTGELRSVKNGPMDFTTAHVLGERFGELPKTDPIGYDHCYLQAGYEGYNPKPRLIARVTAPASGRTLEILTTEPAVQLYTGNFLAGKPADGNFPQHHGFCLECQHLPDAPNQNYPEQYTAILKPGEVYQQTTMHRFSVQLSE